MTGLKTITVAGGKIVTYYQKRITTKKGWWANFKGFGESFTSQFLADLTVRAITGR